MKPRRPRPDEDPFENQDERFDTSDYERFFATPADEEDDDGDGGSDGPSADVASELDSDDPHREPARHADRGFRDESLEDEFTEGEFIEDESVDHTGLDDDDGDDDDAPEPTALERRRRKRQRAIETLYEDAHLHAIQKPAGLSTVDDRWDPDADTVIDVLWRAWLKTDPAAPRPHVVHRLDRDTTGVIIFARHREAQRALREQFRRRTTHKTYVALAQGCPQPAAGTIEIQIDDDMRRAGRMRQVKRGGKECVTHYQVIETFRGYSWVELRPITGRTHQIRISLQAIGHPCAVDPLYGGEPALFASQWIRHYKTGRGREELPIIDRVTLHARRLELTHPATHLPLVIDAPLPKDLEATLKQVRKHLA